MSQSRLLTAVFIVACFAPSRASVSYAFEDLSGWAQEDVCNDMFFPIPWQRDPNNTDVATTENNNCVSFFRGDVEMSKGSMVIGHNGDDYDNDYFGIALGFNSGETSGNSDYLLVQWQEMGLSLVHVEGTGCDSYNIFDRLSSGGCKVKEIARGANLGSTNWGYDTLHTFEVVSYTGNSFVLKIDGQTEFDITPYEVGMGCFPTGGLAFFNYSQDDVHYGSVTIDESNVTECDGACNSLPLANDEFRVNDITAATNSPTPGVTAGSDNAFLFGWGDGSDAYGRRYDAGILGSPILINTDLASGIQMQPRFVATSDGYWTVFSGELSGKTQVYLRKLSLTGTPLGASTRISAQNGCHEGGALLARDTSGDMMAIWSAFQCAADPNSYDIFARGVESDGSTPAPPFQLSATASAVEQHAPRIATISNGTFVGVWRDAGGDGSNYAAVGRRIVAGAADVDEILLNVTTDGQQVPGAVVRRPEGGFFAVWQGKLASGKHGIAGRFFDVNGEPSSAEFQVGFRESDVPDEIGNLDAAALADGGYIIVYYAPDSDQTGIFAQFLNSNANPASEELRVNQSSIDRQIDAHVAVAPNGKIMVTWATGETENASAQEIYARELAPCGYCGDALPDFGEECDLGTDNGEPGSGCSAACTRIICPEGEFCCGNGIIEPGEQCDDGNVLDGDCCSSGCTTYCDDGNPCTQDCNPLDGQCESSIAPATGCRFAEKSALGLKSGDRGKLKWRWKNGENVYCSDVGTPTGNDYHLCVYDGTGSESYTLDAQLHLPPSGLWEQRECDWSFQDKDAANDGLQKIRIKTGEPGRSSLGLSSTAPGPIPSPENSSLFMSMNPDVVVQFHSADGICWESRFDAAKVNTGVKYRTNRLILIRQ